MHWLTRISLAAPRTATVALVLLTALLGAGLPRLRNEVGYRPLLGGDHPSIQTLERFIEDFGGALPVLIVWECGPGRPCEDVFDEASLQMAHDVGGTLGSVPGIRQVLSPATSPLLVPTPDGFAVRQLFENGALASDSEALARHALEDPLWVDHLVTADGSTGVIYLGVSDSRSDTSVRVVDAVEAALAPYESRGFDFHLVGHAVSFAVAGRELAENTALLVPLTTAIIGLILFAATRSWRHAGLTLVTMGAALLWTFGLVGWLDWPNDNVLQVLAPLILVVGVCDSVHLLTCYSKELTRAEAIASHTRRRGAALAAARAVSGACFMTTLTTAIAFLSFATSDLDTFVRFGLISAFGVSVCLILTFTLLPILLTWLGSSRAGEVKAARAWDPVLGAIAATCDRRALPILVGALALALVFGAGWALRLQVDTSWYELFGEQSRVVQWARFVEAHLGELESLELEVELPDGTLVEDPATLRQIRELSEFLSTVDGLGPATSIVTLLDRLEEVLRGADAASAARGSLAANAELLELMSLQAEELVQDWMSFDRGKLRVSAESGWTPIRARREILRQVRGYVDSELPQSWRVQVTGPFTIGHDFVTDLQATQLRSFQTSFILIFLAMMIFLRSVRLATAAMIPTLLPVVVTLGAMGLAGMSLDLGRAMIGAVLIGIAVDDSIHILSVYKKARGRGSSPREAMRGAILEVGRPVVTTSVALALGALTFLMSPWQTVSSFGFYMAIAILGALAADLFVLPALVFAFARPGRRRLPRPEDPALAGGGGRRHGLMLAVLAPVIVTVLLAGLDAAQRSSRRELACWVLPNARAAPLPEVGSSCPLLPHEQVHALRLDGGAELPTGDPSAMRAALDPSVGRVELAVTRDAERQWHDVPVLEHPRGIVLATLGAAALIAMILLCMPLLLIRHSRAAAVAPFSLFYSAVATVLVCAVAGRQSAWLTRIALGALVFLPATLTHLALTFPIERRVLREAPALRWLPYLLSALFVPAAWRALERDALLWPTVIYLLLTLTGGAWIVLMASCGFAIRESTSPLERARARILLYGALILPIIPTWILAGYASTTHDTLILYLGVSTLTMPLPIGLAISRYSLFNLEVDARSLVARLLYAASAACVLAVIFTGATGALASSSPLATPPVLFATAFAGIVMLEPMRKRLLGIFESLLSPRASELVRLREELARRVIELRDQDEVARLIGSMLETALRSGGGCVFLHSPSGWRPAHAFGRSPPVKPCLASDASALLCDRTLLSLPEPNDEPTEERRRLLDAAVAVAAMLRRGGEPLGLILLQGSLTGIPYTRLDLDFVASATTHASVALHNARLAEDLLAAERHSTTAQIALALAHDVGKELDWLRRLVERLPGRLDDEPRARRDLATIAKLTEDLAHTIGGFLRRAREPVHEGCSSLSETIEQAVSAMARLHGPGRITRCVDPRLREVSLAQSLLRVLTNLLDNALRATAEPEPVHLFATLEDGWVRIAVADRGPGMTSPIRSRAFELGFTTRASQGGSGIGLAVSREIVRTLGGVLELDEPPSGGTVARVRVPLAPEVR